MKYQYLFLIIFLPAFLAANRLPGQITITAADMPDPGDTIRTSVALNIGTIDPAPTGTNYTWDFSGLTPVSQNLDSFLAITAAPLTYQLIFNNPFDPTKATIAAAKPNIDFIPGFEITSVYEFFRETSSYFAFMGFAGQWSGLPIPIKYDQPDVLYPFPLTYGTTGMSESEFELGLPSLGYLYSHRTRSNSADGFGTLITPYGSFQVIRLRSDVTEFDSVYVDSLGQGIAINRSFTEYKWMGAGYGLPLLNITVEGPLTTIAYIDSNRTSISSAGIINDHLAHFSVFPNPSEGEINIEYMLREPSPVTFRLYTPEGRMVLIFETGKKPAGIHREMLNLSGRGLHQGLYYLELMTNTDRSVRRVFLAN